jgi:hypothetical protein
MQILEGNMQNNISEEKEKRNKRILYLVAAIIAVPILYKIVTYNENYDPKCGKVYVQESFDQLHPIVNEWALVVNQAGEANKYTIKDEIETMLDLYEQTSNVSVPSCLIDGKLLMLNGMNKFIEASLGIMKGESAELINQKINSSTKDIEDATSEFQRISACAPNCD